MGGVQVVGGGYRNGGGVAYSVNGEMRKDFVQTFSNLFLKTLTEGAVTTEAEKLF